MTTTLDTTYGYAGMVYVADVNNDGYPDILSTDMLPYDPYILKRSEGEDSWDILSLKIGYGYNHQYTRNNLQLNRVISLEQLNYATGTPFFNQQ